MLVTNMFTLSFGGPGGLHWVLSVRVEASIFSAAQVAFTALILSFDVVTQLFKVPTNPGTSVRAFDSFASAAKPAIT